MTAPVKIVIDHLSGSRAGERQEFDLLPKLRFGRHPENEVAFDPHRDLDASTRHAELRQGEGSAYTLVDIGSSNGTYRLDEGKDPEKVTQVPIAQGIPVEIEFGEGGPRLRIFVGDPALLQAPIPQTMVGGRRKPEPPGTVVPGAARPSRSAPATKEEALDENGEKKPLTMSMMLSRAKDHAQAAPKKGGFNKTTVFMKSMVDQALNQSSRRFKIVIFTVSTMFVIAVGGLVYWNMSLTRTTKAVAQASEETSQGAGPRIVKLNRDNLYLLSYTDDHGKDNAFCSSFAVRSSYLATNSHCVVAIERFTAKGFKVFAVRNGDAKARFDVKSSHRHPKYEHGANHPTIDVGLVEIAGTMPSTVKLADKTRLQGLQTGANMFTYGFPGFNANPAEPVATLTGGQIGRITDLDERDTVDYAEKILVQHSAYTMEGTSGSPVFDTEGVVIAVNAGSFTFQRQKTILGTGDKATVADTVKMADTLAGYNYAFRIDTLEDLLSAEGL
jgi:V8-like Glu-specific endopeptidase